jgi:hypothetical protein
LIDAVICSLPPGGAAKSARVLSMRPEVQVPPLLRALMTRWPVPSRYTFWVELVVCSFSPVPNPVPMS